MTVIDSEPAIHARQREEDIPGVTRPMTYEEYLASPEEMARYDIIDGYKVYRLYGPENDRMTNPTRKHQRIQGRLFRRFLAYEEEAKAGQVIQAPCDVFITGTPRIRARQPDILFISQERLFLNPSEDIAHPLDPAPELVVEILSPADRLSVLAAKIADYRSVDVKEIWLAHSGSRTVEVIALSEEEIKTVATYSAGQIVESRVFPGQIAAVDDIFAE